MLSKERMRGMAEGRGECKLRVMKMLATVLLIRNK